MDTPMSWFLADTISASIGQRSSIPSWAVLLNMSDISKSHFEYHLTSIASEVHLPSCVVPIGLFVQTFQSRTFMAVLQERDNAGGVLTQDIFLHQENNSVVNRKVIVAPNLMTSSIGSADIGSRKYRPYNIWRYFFWYRVLHVQKRKRKIFLGKIFFNIRFFFFKRDCSMVLNEIIEFEGVSDKIKQVKKKVSSKFGDETIEGGLLLGRM
ncbi:hypothetical protein CDAR_199081 [Caerostris darwini]|uniref:Uncharacterized protein n=1 Tax=Caerostris darwini TaxID=1538125 RepID=A0AAV4PU74_9ARAC|nr:hypothetical protein CDAR_199081 [Caerostris darwini]